MPNKIIMSEPTLHLETLEGDSNALLNFENLHRYFSGFFRIAMALAAAENIELKLVPPEQSTLFVRDRCVLFELGDEAYCIYGDSDVDHRNFPQCKPEFLATIEELYPEIKIVKLNETHLEGGNVGIIHQGQTTYLLHNNSARAYYGGHYAEQTDDDTLAKEDAIRTTENLAKLFANDSSVKVLPIEIDVEHLTSYRVRETYYHLDCFLTITPDNKVVLLNAKILTQESLARLKETIGEQNIIDLAYPMEMVKSSSVPYINAAMIPADDGSISFIFPQMPDELLETLQAALEGHRVYTPESLDNKSKFYNPEYEQKFMKIMQELGFAVDLNRCIFDQFPTRDKCIVDSIQRFLSNKVVSKRENMEWNEIANFLRPPTNTGTTKPVFSLPTSGIRLYMQHNCTGVYNHGSFHCMTLDLKQKAMPSARNSVKL